MGGARIGYRGISVDAAGIRKVADTAERTALTPADGDFVIQLDNDSLYYYNGVSWEIYLDDSSYDDLLTVIAGLAAHLADGTDAHDASAISVVAQNGLVATDVQTALEEIDAQAVAAQADADQALLDIAGHIADGTDAHDASAISVAPAGNLAADDVQEALVELQGDIDILNTHIMVAVANSALNNSATFDPANNRRQIQRVSGNGAAVTITDLGETNAQSGDELILIGTDNTNTVTIPMSVTNTIINGSVTLGLNDMISFIYVDGKWKEQSRSA